MYSLIVTAKMNGVDPQVWLADIARIAGHPAHRLDDLLPWRWAAARASVIDQAAYSKSRLDELLPWNGMKRDVKLAA
jgi:hypothetical protein